MEMTYREPQTPLFPPSYVNLVNAKDHWKIGESEHNTDCDVTEWALLARYVYTYEEFVIETEAPQCNRMTATGQDTDNKRILYK